MRWHVIDSTGTAQGGLRVALLKLVKLERRERRRIGLITGAPTSDFLKTTDKVLWARRRGRLRLPGFVREIMVHGAWSMLGIRLLGLGGAGRVALSLTSHGMRDRYFRKQSLLKEVKKNIFLALYGGSFMKSLRRLYVTSPEEKRYFLEQPFSRYCESFIILFPNDEEDADEVKVATGASGNLAFAGRFHPKKNLGRVLANHASLSKNDAVLYLFGPRPDELPPELREDGAVRAMGFVSDWRRLFLKEGGGGFLFPSKQENYCFSLIEALEAGLPALISDRIHTHRFVTRYRAGFVDDNSPAGIRRLLERWFALTQDERREMSRNARRCFEQVFSKGKNLTAYIEQDTGREHVVL